MPEPQGGLRDRMVFECFANMLKSSMATLGWFEPGRSHAPLFWRTSIVAESEELPLNTLTVASTDVRSADMEIGSGLSQDTFVIIIDFYAQNDALGRHVTGDIRDILRGKLVTDHPGFVVYDLRDDPPTPFSFAEIEGVLVDRAEGFDAPFRRHWFSVLCELVEDRA